MTPKLILLALAFWPIVSLLGCWIVGKFLKLNQHVDMPLESDQTPFEPQQTNKQNTK